MEKEKKVYAIGEEFTIDDVKYKVEKMDVSDSCTGCCFMTRVEGVRNWSAVFDAAIATSGHIDCGAPKELDCMNPNSIFKKVETE